MKQAELRNEIIKFRVIKNSLLAKLTFEQAIEMESDITTALTEILTSNILKVLMQNTNSKEMLREIYDTLQSLHENDDVTDRAKVLAKSLQDKGHNIDSKKVVEVVLDSYSKVNEVLINKYVLIYPEERESLESALHSAIGVNEQILSEMLFKTVKI